MKLKINKAMLAAEYTAMAGGTAWRRFNADGGYTLLSYGTNRLYGPPESDGWSVQRYDAQHRQVRGAASMTLADAIDAEPQS